MAGLEVRVQNLDCEGCSSKIRRALLKLKGVKEVEIDAEMQKITVRGYGLQEKKVMKAIRSIGKTAEPWPFPGGHSHLAASFYAYPAGIASSYYREPSAACSNAAELRAFFHTPAMYSVAVATDETVASLFSDENPHACVIM
ncbi:heavy metal-associated isoprenylated plant protein 22 [Canna indica]|uniref:Heavy metal-associated isoprenylated plant protein 22 n=1 Tax=Canna indica TaxID=4628 RepID=A0AAQ3JMM3_9LILI|nr:heavy metal-associated isoprenylated plant protein 22 [Canna indica]